MNTTIAGEEIKKSKCNQENKIRNHTHIYLSIYKSIYPKMKKKGEAESYSEGAMEERMGLTGWVEMRGAAIRLPSRLNAAIAISYSSIRSDNQILRFCSEREMWNLGFLSTDHNGSFCERDAADSWVARAVINLSCLRRRFRFGEGKFA